MFATFAEPYPPSRPRPRREAGPRSEALESRQLLASSSGVFPDLNFAIGLPVPSLETGSDLGAVSSQSVSLSPFPTLGEPVIGMEAGSGFFYDPDELLMAGEASVSLPLITSIFPPLNGQVGPTYSAGATTAASVSPPATTLSPLGNVSETAVAAASAVTRATPGMDDRVQGIGPPRMIVPLPHLWGPNRVPPRGRGFQPPSAEPPSARPVQPPVEAVPVTPRPAPVEPKAGDPATIVPQHQRPVVPGLAPTIPNSSVSLRSWDAAIEQVEASLAVESQAQVVDRAQEALAIGVLMAAWGGWNVAARLEGRSRRRPLAPSLRTLEAGPGNGGGR